NRHSRPRCASVRAEFHARTGRTVIMRTMAFGIAALLACFVVAPAAFAGASTAGSSAMGVGTSASSKTTSPDNNNKVVLQARDDAASFIASDGRIRGAQL